MYIEIFGARGTHPVCRERFLKYGGNTTAILMNSGEYSLIIDAGTGIINLSRSKKLLPNVLLLLTHYHFDHIIGLPYASFIYSDTVNTLIMGPSILDVGVQDVVDILSLPIFSPFNITDRSANLTFNSIQDGDIVEKGNFKIAALHSPAHPRGGVLLYRIEAEGKTVVIATDTEGYVGSDRRLIDFASSADLLIHDAQYTHEEYLKHQGYGHSTPEMAAEVAAKAGAKKLLLFHHDPKHTDELIEEKEKRAREIFPETQAAYEGMILEL